MNGKKLENLRKQKGLSLTKLSKLTGISKSYLSLLEREIQNNPSKEVLKKLAKVFDMEVQKLLENEGFDSQALNENKRVVKSTLKLEIELSEGDVDCKKLKQLKELIKALNSDTI
jgi:transcriptional regulator with XRE-family HTH domain